MNQPSRVRQYALPQSFLVNPHQLLAMLRVLIVVAASVLAVSQHVSLHAYLVESVVLGGLLGSQLFGVWLSQRQLTLTQHRSFFITNLLIFNVATFLSTFEASSFFILFPIIVAEIALEERLNSALLLTTLTAFSYSIVFIAGVSQQRQVMQTHDWSVLFLEAALLYMVTVIGSHVVQAWNSDRQHVVQLSLLDRLSLLLGDTHQLDDVLERFVQLVPQVLPVQACAIVVPEEGSSRHIWANLGADTTSLVEEALLLQTVELHETQQIVMISPLDRHTYSLIRAMPILVEHEVVGMMSIASSSTRPLNENETRIFESLVRHIEQAFRNARLYTLEAQSANDSRELEHFKSEMLASVSHEFRLPLASILLAAETLLAAEQRDPVIERRLLHNIQRSARRLTGFVQDLLDLARLESHQLTLRNQLCDLQTLVQSSIDFVEPQCEIRNQRLTIEWQITVGCQIHADGKRIEQVLNNLLMNACQYTPDGGEISVTVAAMEALLQEAPYGDFPPGTAVAVAVSDSGPGIPREERGHIFERFQQGDIGRKRNAGTGLGLYIAKSVVDLHGGCIWVGENPRGGSTFWIVLPRFRETLDDDRRADDVMESHDSPRTQSFIIPEVGQE